jgi:uncharacterized protein (DUF1501 family)
MKKHTRRSLLELGWRSLGAAASLGLTKAFGEVGGSGRRILVGIQLMGGNDSNNLIVPLDPQTYSAYAAGRGELALPANSLLPIQSKRLRASFGLPPQTPELAELYNEQALAVVADVGDMLRRATKAQYFANTAAVVAPDASSHIASSKMQFLLNGWVLPQWWSGLLKESEAAFEKQAFKFSDGMTSASTYGSWITGAHVDNPALVSALNSVVVRTPFAKTGIAKELLQAVKMAQAGANLGLGNQMITCVMSGWDTHENELQRNAQLYTDLSQALNSFYRATVELGISHEVTAFTWSEFNRALAPNTTHGTAHGWGGHQMVLGGSVLGGEIYGAMPSFLLGGPDDVGGNGTWLPAVATVQYAATLANWFGLSLADQRADWPSLANFAVANLGFMRP